MSNHRGLKVIGSILLLVASAGGAIVGLTYYDQYLASNEAATIEQSDLDQQTGNEDTPTTNEPGPITTTDELTEAGNELDQLDLDDNEDVQTLDTQTADL